MTETRSGSVMEEVEQRARLRHEAETERVETRMTETRSGSVMEDRPASSTTGCVDRALLGTCQG